MCMFTNVSELTLSQRVLILDEYLVLATQRSFIWPKRRASCFRRYTDAHLATLEPRPGPLRNAISGIPHIQYTFPATPLFSLSITLFRRGLSKKLLHNDAPLQEKWPAAKAVGHVPILRTHVVHLLCEVCCMQTKYYVKDSELSRRNATGGE